MRLILILALLVLATGCAKEIHEASATNDRANVQRSTLNVQLSKKTPVIQAASVVEC